MIAGLARVLSTSRFRILTFVFVSFVLALLAPACGNNKLKDRAPKSDVEEAQILLEKGKYPEARTLLEAHLAKSADDYKAVALLAASYAAEIGLSVIEISEKSLSSGNKSQQDLISQLLPEATQENVAVAKQAKSIILSIPETVRNADMKFGATLYVTAYTLLLLEQFKLNPTVPTPEQAAEFLDSIDKAATLAAANNIPTEKIQSAKAQIANEPGATDAEKLNSYLEKAKARNGGTLPTSQPSASPAALLGD
jgi:hypothetical protein